MDEKRSIPAALTTLILLAVILGVIVLSIALFRGLG
jgi:hypothetical protein